MAFGNNWNENNQEEQTAEQFADYVEAVPVISPTKTPNQLRNHTRFLLEHTEGAIDYMMKNFQENLIFLRDAKTK